VANSRGVQMCVPLDKIVLAYIFFTNLYKKPSIYLVKQFEKIDPLSVKKIGMISKKQEDS